ncbi:MAG: 6-phosphofructokinase [Planctomycetales bacterium]|jgi:6-phosphofructokinase 1|nr:6-phosphofructokinase [Planctomycetales bacterium]
MLKTSSKVNVQKVAILFSGGPAPAANAVISAAAASFRRAGIEVYGMLHGYSGLMGFSAVNPLQEGRDYIRLTVDRIQQTRCSGGILIGTARENPGKDVTVPEDLHDPQKCAKLRTVYDGLRSLGIDALVSIGGDDTLKTANKLLRYQDTLSTNLPRIQIVHVPKTIDNDYNGIDFTFGFFTAVEQMAAEIRNLLADAEASRAYFIVESMGRSAGWLAYGAAIAGEASLVLSIEDLDQSLLTTEHIQNPKTGVLECRSIMNMPRLIEKLTALMRYREEVEGKPFGVIVLAEGLAEKLPLELLGDVEYDPFGHIAVAGADLGKKIARLVADEFQKQTQRKRKVNGVQLGYEVRCARPQAFDVILGSQLGVGAYRGLIENGQTGVMVSVERQFDLRYVPFEELVDQTTLTTIVRFIKPESDFYKLARILETNVPSPSDPQ